MRGIAHVAAFDESRATERATERATVHAFWSRVKFDLGKMRLPPNRIKLVAQQLAERVPLSEPKRKTVKQVGGYHAGDVRFSGIAD